MKKSFLVGIFLVIFVVTPAQAEETSSSSAMHPTMKMVRENIDHMIQTKREEAMTHFQAKREAFQEKLATLKDEQKKSLAENIDTRLATINKNRTDEMSRALTRLQEYTDRLTTLAETAKSEGKNTTALDAALQLVETDLENAQDAITAQAGKEYIATVTTDAALRSAFSTIVKQLKTDLLTTHKTLETAREDLRKAVLEWEKIKTETTPSASSSGQTNL